MKQNLFGWFTYRGFLTATCWNNRNVRVESAAGKTVHKLFVGGVHLCRQNVLNCSSLVSKRISRSRITRMYVNSRNFEIAIITLEMTYVLHLVGKLLCLLTIYGFVDFYACSPLAVVLGRRDVSYGSLTMVRVSSAVKSLDRMDIPWWARSGLELSSLSATSPWFDPVLLS